MIRKGGSVSGGLLEEVRAQLQAKLRLPSPAMCRAIRLAAGVSQERIARELGVHRVTVARWELGARRPRTRRAAAYAALLEELRREVDREQPA
jgi:DNA-binding transcriptional regulator YiaG